MGDTELRPGALAPATSAEDDALEAHMIEEMKPQKIDPLTSLPALVPPAKPEGLISILHHGIVPAYRLVGERVQWGRDFIEPTVFFVPTADNPRPPSPLSFAAMLPPSPTPIRDRGEFQYDPVAALTMGKAELTSPIYEVRPAPFSYVVEFHEFTGDLKMDWTTNGANRVEREEDIRARFHPSMDSWLFQGKVANYSLVTKANFMFFKPNMFKEMDSQSRDRLLDALEDYGKLAWTRLLNRSPDGKWNTQFEARIGRAAALALSMRVHGGPRDFGAIVGARPVPIVAELARMAGADAFKIQDVPWIVYYSSPRLSMVNPMEQAFACCAAVAAVAGAIASEYGAKLKEKKGDPEAVYNSFKATVESLPQEFYDKLTLYSKLKQALYLGYIHGACLAGSIMFAQDAEAKDERKRKAIKWSVTFLSNILLTVPSVAGAPAATNLLSPIVGAVVDPIANSIAEAVVQNTHWLPVLKIVLPALKNHLHEKATSTGQIDVTNSFINGIDAITVLVSDAGELAKELQSHPEGTTKLAEIASRHKGLHDLLSWLFDYKVVPEFLRNATIGS